MNMLKTSLLSGVAIVIKMLTLLGLNKVLAIYVGPAGYAALGQFQNAVQIITTLASGAISTGVTKYTAEYYEDESKQRAVWRTAGTISLFGSGIVAIGVMVFNQPLAGWFLKNESLGSVFIWFGATLVLYVFNALLLAILNGKKEIKRYVTASIAGSLFSLSVTTVMAVQMGLYGVLVALAIYQSLTFAVTLSLTYNASWFKLRYLFGGVDKQAATSLAKYTLMALTSAACVPFSHILIRNHLGEALGWEAAGYWEAMWRLSGAYLMLVTATLSVYYLPKLSEVRTLNEIKKEIILGYKVILPVVAVGCFSIYLLRNNIINGLFSSEFSEMEVLFAWQLLGDFLKVGSWLLGYVLTARAMLGLYVTSEVIFSILFYILVIGTTEKYGIEAASIAHAINYGCHLIFMAAVLRTKKII